MGNFSKKEGTMDFKFEKLRIWQTAMGFGENVLG